MAAGGSILRAVVCRVEAGLNDDLVQIWKCFQYCVANNRQLVVFIPKKSAVQSFFRMLRPRKALSIPVHLVFDSPPLSEEGLTVLPHFLDSPFSTLAARYDTNLGNLVATISGQPFTFDFSRDHDEQFLVHAQVGGGAEGVHGLGLFELREEFEDLLPVFEKSTCITFVHIRATDYWSDFEKVLHALSRSTATLYLATDSFNVLSRFLAVLESQMEMLHSHVFPDDSEKPIHYLDLTNHSARYHSEGIRVLLDLWAAANSIKFVYTPVFARVPNARPRISGFSQLAKAIFRDSDKAEAFFGRAPVKRGFWSRREILVASFKHRLFLLRSGT